MKKLTISELARQIGISRELLHRHRQRGCPTDSLESALAWREKNLDHTQTKTGRILGNEGGKKRKPASQVNDDSQVNDSQIVSSSASDMAELVHTVNETQLDLSGTDADILFKNSRALKEKAAALQAAAEHEKFIGELVLKSDVEKLIFERARQFRDGLVNLSRRLSPELTGLNDINKVEALLTKEHRLILEAFSKLPVIE
ncbi:MAG: hypothetical protein U1D41_05740 [Nitrosomonas sp.]|uniref:hypothetical protein n=1 Tax=Nitrosomonas sp. TaxID=42353 RepID=UPI002734CEDA|nr:hypothetical protein [Nitrosomonas sp.]MDP3279949.1 hypothetical protein [Nitrosomonas sp.]MDP3663836.1 hypothetical protein [Nitrosomonas sp.]MDZ4105654.1 hypothetical protein [Nitrosomonas sp.]